MSKLHMKEVVGKQKKKLYEDARSKPYDQQDIDIKISYYNQLIKNDPEEFEINEDSRWRYYDKFGMALRYLELEDVVRIERYCAALIGESYAKQKYNWDETDSEVQEYLEDRLVYLCDKWSEGKTDLEFESFVRICYMLLEKYENESINN